MLKALLFAVALLAAASAQAQSEEFVDQAKWRRDACFAQADTIGRREVGQPCLESVDNDAAADPDYCKGMARPADGAHCAQKQSRAAPELRAAAFQGQAAEAYCARWANNGMTGAAQGLRGKSLKFVYEPMPALMARIKQGMTDVDGMAFAEEDYTPEARTFLEASVTEGWRWAQGHLDRSEALPSYEETREQFYQGCMSRSRT